MPDRRPTSCVVCGGHESEVGPISWRGKCAAHGKQRMEENARQLQVGEGPFVEHWERRTVMSIIRRQTKRRKEAAA